MRIGIDLGGTKIEAVALGDSGQELARLRTPTPKGAYEDTLQAVVTAVQTIERQVGMMGSVGVGAPGAISPSSGRIKNANSTALIGHQLDLALALGREVRVSNDANCFALSEAVDGAGAGAPLVFGAIVGTGAGAGLVVDGRVLAGRNAIAGEWGHNPLPWPQPHELPGPRCYCGRRGCLETFLSGPGFALDYRGLGGEPLAPSAIVARAGGGESTAIECLRRYVHRMARGLAHVINMFDPDIIVLGGGMSNVESLYEDVPARWGEFVFSDHVETRLVPPRHGDSSGVRGAAWLWPRDGEDSPARRQEPLAQ